MGRYARTGFLYCAIVLAAAWGEPQPTPSSPAQEEIEELVGKLGSESPENRTVAELELYRIGPSVLPLLGRAALIHVDPEVRRRSRALFQRMSRGTCRLDWARPASETLYDYATGLPIHVVDTKYGMSLTLVTNREQRGPENAAAAGDGTEQLRPFYLGTFEVTFGDWIRVLPDHAVSLEFSDAPLFWNRPVHLVSRGDVVEFLRKAGFRLPTGPEWQHALGGGDEHAIDEVAWHAGNSKHGLPMPVGTKRPNTRGLYDMRGNVWELCGDGVLRGGSCRSDAGRGLETKRARCFGTDVGLRIARSP